MNKNVVATEVVTNGLAHADYRTFDGPFFFLRELNWTALASLQEASNGENVFIFAAYFSSELARWNA